MKTQIIQLEPHDDVISTRDKMGWSQTSRILLVWPSRGKVLARRLDLLLLQRHSIALGTQLALVTHDPDVIHYAHILGIQAFKNTHQAQETRWNRLNRRPPRANRYAQLKAVQPRPINAEIIRPKPVEDKSYSTIPALRLLFFTLGVLSFLSIGAIFIPKADIILTPTNKVEETTLAIQASALTDRINLAGIVPVHAISVIVEGRDSLDATGTSLVPDKPAEGQVLFTNLTEQPVIIPAGTIVSSRDGQVRFATDADHEIPAGNGHTLLVDVKAVQPGREGNLPANSIQAIENNLGVSLSVTNPEPTSGGSARISTAPALLDYTRLRDQLKLNLQANAQAEIETRLNKDDILLTATPVLSSTLAEDYVPANPEPTNELSLTLRLEYRALVVKGDDLHELASSVLDTILPPGFEPVPNTLVVESLTQPVIADQSTAHWKIHTQRSIRAVLSHVEAINLSLGQSPGKARDRLLKVLPLDGVPIITLSPAWWPQLPILPFRINVSMVDTRNNDLQVP
jgi:hypothetical protein